MICPPDRELEQKIYKLTESRGLTVTFNTISRGDANNLAHSLACGGMLTHYRLLSSMFLSPWLYRECPDIQVVLFCLRD